MSAFMILLVIGVALPAVSLAASFLFSGLEGVFHALHMGDFGDFGHGLGPGHAAGAGHGAFSGHDIGAGHGAVPGHDIGAGHGALSGHDIGAGHGALSGHDAGAAHHALSGHDAGMAHGVHLSFLPMSPIVWCIMLIVTGASGEIMSRVTGLPSALIWPAALFAGYAAMTIVNNGLLVPLKRANNTASDAHSFAGADAEVIEAIPSGKVGAIRFEGKSGMVVYAAVSENEADIPQGAAVRIVGIERGRAIVARAERETKESAEFTNAN